MRRKPKTCIWVQYFPYAKTWAIHVTRGPIGRPGSYYACHCTETCPVNVKPEIIAWAIAQERQVIFSHTVR